VRALDPNAAIRCAGKGNAERVRVNYRYVFVVARSVVMVSPWLVNVLERPHDKSQKEGHTNVQSGSTTNHHRIMPYKVRCNQGYKLPQSSSVGKVLSTSCALGLLTTKSSLRIFPSRKTSSRLANCAMSCSCVTKTIVSPASFNL
jgi:hypothetical protein